MKSYILTLLTIMLVCLTIIFIYTSVILWPYREALALVSFGGIFVSFLTWVYVTARARLVEQVLRLVRIRYHEEIPLDAYGQMQYLPRGFQRQERQARYFEEDEE